MNEVRAFPDPVPAHMRTIRMVEAIAGSTHLDKALAQAKANLIESAQKINHCVAVYNVRFQHSVLRGSGNVGSAQYTVIAYGSAVESRI